MTKQQPQQRERQQKLAQETQKKAQSGSPLDRFLKDVPDEIKNMPQTIRLKEFTAASVTSAFAMDEKYSPRIQTAVAVLLIASKKAPAGNTQKNGPMPDRSAISGHMSEHNPRTAYNVNVVTTLTSNDATKTWLAFEFSLGNMTALSYESGRKLADMPIAAMTTAATP